MYVSDIDVEYFLATYLLRLDDAAISPLRLLQDTQKHLGTLARRKGDIVFCYLFVPLGLEDRSLNRQPRSWLRFNKQEKEGSQLTRTAPGHKAANLIPQISLSAPIDLTKLMSPALLDM